MSVVYFIRCGARIKIGVTTNLKARVGALRTSAPEELEVVAIVPGATQLERKMHGDLHAFRITGEWFSDCPEVRAAIGAVVDKQGGTFSPDIQLKTRPLPPPPVVVHRSRSNDEMNEIESLFATRRAGVVHFGEMIDSPVIQDMPRAREMERRLGVEAGSIARKLYVCADPFAFHLHTLKQIDKFHEKHIKVGDRITLAVMKQEFSACNALSRASQLLVDMADEAFSALQAVHRPIVNDRAFT